MAEYKFTAALNAASIPTMTRSQQRSIMIAQLDNRLRDPSSNNTTNQENNPQNLPQIIYGENVIPTEAGLQSVGYVDVGGAFPAAGTAEEVFTLRQETYSALFSPAGGYNYMKTADSSVWASGGALAGAPTTTVVSIAYVNGETYVCYANTAILQYDGATNTLIDVSGTLTSIAAADIVAICGSGNYMIAVLADGETHWSSLTNALDFTPSAATGAGFQIPLDLRGAPKYLTSSSGGFLIHCVENTVAAVYTQNSSAPWIFREIKGSGGITDATAIDKGNYRISKESTSGFIYLLGSHGLQALNLRDAEIMQPHIADFLAGRAYETFDSATSLITLVRDVALRTKVQFLLNRYLVISYGPQTDTFLSYALWFDVVLKRWGKLKVTHADIFTWQESSNTSRSSIYVIGTSGQMQRVILDARAGTDTGVVILGRYQLNRTNQICSQELELELIDSTEDVTAKILTNYDGTNVGEVAAMTLYANSGMKRTFQKQIEGENLSYLLQGTFTLATVLLTATRGARM